ncbi:ABC transporter permease [Pseudoalteromonas sp. PS5]|uniref:ABC transporter permease n=1 Tax=Pseudoalteromonas sp. PS5 TaxID=1437473 RepID=UPI000FFE5C59|nr:ABC transporter permease [Pseudoalteromonas sp. PS5]RXE96740.1 FtsX-like permease family protein [Pseudoalteromonas sp. PS5]
MLKNYLLIAYRSLLQQKLYSAINILGLAIGLAICISMAIFVESELGYDKFIQNHEQVYRSSVKWMPPSAPEIYYAQGQVFNAQNYKTHFEEVVDATRFRQVTVALGEGRESFIHEGVLLADANFIDFFSLQVLHGNGQTALNNPNSIVLTEAAAELYFGRTSVVGEALLGDGKLPLKVTAVIKDLPQRTHLNVFALISMETATTYYGDTSWQRDPSFNYFTYVRLADGVSGHDVEAKIPSYLENRYGHGASDTLDFTLMPVSDIYLHSQMYGEMKENGDINTVYSFSVISALILFIACVNFMNLSTATATKRAKEVGVRKTLGAKQQHLVVQFIVEAMMLSYIALIIAVALVEACLPMFASFIGKPLSFDFYSQPVILAILLLLGFVVGLISGSYPAFYLSGFKPAKVLKGEITQGRSGTLLRKGLVVFQFSVAIVLIIATVVSNQQLKYARAIELGYDKDNTFVLNRLYTDIASQQRSALKTELLSHPNINSVTASSAVPTQSIVDAFGMVNPKTQLSQTMPTLAVDEDYFSSYNIKLLTGRGFSRDFPADIFTLPSETNPRPHFSVVINEKAAQSLGFSSDEAIGKTFEVRLTRHSSATATIIGVTQNYYFSSLRTEISPTYHLLREGEGNAMAIKFQGDASLIRDFIEATWRKLIPEQQMELTYLQTEFEQMYQQEDKEITVFNLFSLLAIFIACLGLFGLASFTTKRRTKEIGVRKVLGASVMDIVLLINKEFSKQVLIANLIAWPLAYIVMREWLNNFVYRIELSFVPFLAAAVIAFVIAWVTVGSLTMVAAQARPINSLRYE